MKTEFKPTITKVKGKNEHEFFIEDYKHEDGKHYMLVTGHNAGIRIQMLLCHETAIMLGVALTKRAANSLEALGKQKGKP